MPRYRSEEAKRNLKINLDRIPEWEAELESIRSHFQRFDLSKISSAATLIYEMHKKLPISGRFDNREEHKKQLEYWKGYLSVDSLLHMSYNLPYFIRQYIMGYAHFDIVNKIRSTLRETERELAKCRARGATNSFLVSIFTSKVSVDTLKYYEKKAEEYLALSREIPKIEDALRLLDEVCSESDKYAGRILKIEKQISLAQEKRESMQRFEEKHGKVFAKAAVADDTTRSRVKSLKRLVKKTKDCPYCGADLGSDPHLDHIYPVTKGGLSILENLVWCCSACNTVKSDKGLIKFLKERGLSIDQTLSRLHDLGKHV